jgi:8-oxo-dGTP pyrophosphatase MutT (NUDIX family)
MMSVAFCDIQEIADDRIAFAVIAARQEGHWLLCRHKERTTWEIPGGHREAGESVESAARCELYEETGATRATLQLLDLYAVTIDGNTTYGALYLADVEARGEIPAESEIAEVKPFDALPSALTYPDIQGALFSRVQYRLNIRHSADELWDVYDIDRRPLGKTHRRGEPLPAGEYHLIVLVLLKHGRGELLITRRAPNKGFPNMWEFTGGSALAGDDSLTSALREMREETGIELDPKNGRIVAQEQAWSDAFGDLWLFCQDFDLDKIVLQENETTAARTATREDILRMIDDGEFMPPSPALKRLLEGNVLDR